MIVLLPKTLWNFVKRITNIKKFREVILWQLFLWWIRKSSHYIQVLLYSYWIVVPWLLLCLSNWTHWLAWASSCLRQLSRFYAFCIQRHIISHRADGLAPLGHHLATALVHRLWSRLAKCPAHLNLMIPYIKEINTNTKISELNTNLLLRQSDKCY